MPWNFFGVHETNSAKIFLLFKEFVDRFWFQFGLKSVAGVWFEILQYLNLKPIHVSFRWLGARIASAFNIGLQESFCLLLEVIQLEIINYSNKVVVVRILSAL